MNQYEVTEELRSIIANNMQYTTWTVSTPHLVALVNKCIEAEREACAVLCDAEQEGEGEWYGCSLYLAEKIRARGEKK